MRLILKKACSTLAHVMAFFFFGTYLWAAFFQPCSFAWTHSNKPINISFLVLFTFFNTVIARITPNLLFFAMQLLVGFGNGMLLGRRSYKTVNKTENSSTQIYLFIPKYHSLPFLVWRISGSRCPLRVFVEVGAEMIVVSTILSF